MMHNDPEHPELARESQDVEEPPVRSEENVQFAGRGMWHIQRDKQKKGEDED